MTKTTDHIPLYQATANSVEHGHGRGSGKVAEDVVKTEDMLEHGRLEVEVRPAMEEYLCSICHELVCEPVKTTCSHFFDRTCLETWLRRSSTCPLCKARVCRRGSVVDRDLLSAVERWFPHELGHRREELASIEAMRRARELRYESSPSQENAELIRAMRRDDIIQSDEVELAMLALPRHWFFPPDELSEEDIYSSSPNRIASLGFNVSAPNIHAMCLEALRLRPGHRLLDVGCGCGIIAMVGAVVVGETGCAHGIDIRDQAVALSESNHDRLHTVPALANTNVRFFNANCFDFNSPEGLKYDRIHAGASCPPGYEEELQTLLAPGGIIVMPIEGSLVRITHHPVTNTYTRENLLAVRFGTLVLPEEDDTGMAPTPSDGLARYASLGCTLHCKSCRANICSPNDLARLPETNRVEVIDGEAFAVQSNLSTVVIGEPYEYREVYAGIFAYLHIGFPRRNASDVTCASCGIYLGMKMYVTGPRGPLSSPQPPLTRDSPGRVHLGKKYLDLCYPTGDSVRPGGHIVCEGEGCGNILTTANAELSAQHCWDLGQGRGVESATYYNNLLPGSFREENRRWDTLAQGRMEVTDVYCSRCNAQVGWRFVGAAARNGEPRNQIGRFGLVDSQVAKIRTLVLL